jgi:hypothetical protein
MKTFLILFYDLFKSFDSFLENDYEGFVWYFTENVHNCKFEVLLIMDMIVAKFLFQEIEAEEEEVI